MINRKLYLLSPCFGDRVAVYRLDKKDTLQGVVFIDGLVRYDNSPWLIPEYIKQEAVRILHASDFELKRGYTLTGESCQIG
jgi:hypothetical protein